ncbi:MAG: ubiquinol-cytochrome c reductase iron-sulfur subunit [Limisphaerales bacterium]
MKSRLLPPAVESLPCACAGCGDGRERGELEASSLGRRNFLKAAARAVLLVEASGLPWGELCAPAARAGKPVGIVRVVLSDFPALASVDGYIHLQVADQQFQTFPVILTRTAAQTFVAVSSVCTHSGCPVQPYSAAAGGLLCPCHGSLYTPQGVVLRGPAGFDLTGYLTRLVSAGVLEIEIPGIGFALAGAIVDTAVGRRMRLSFSTTSERSYEIKRRTSMTTPAVTVPFSLTETGAATQTQLTGSGASVTLYVEADMATGFLSVARS